jgi:hypothetical protein
VFVILPLLVVFGTAALISVLGVVRPRFRYHWLLAVFGTLAAWILAWLLRLRFSSSVGPLEGNALGLALPSLSFSVDPINWALALAILTIGLAVLLTDVSRIHQTGWVVWAGDLGLIGVGLMAVLAANPTTMLLAWTVVDLIELGIQLRELRDEEMRRRAFIFFTLNLLGTMTVLGAVIASGSVGIRMQFSSIPTEAQVYLILAVGLRMGVFPLQVAFLKDIRQQRGQGTLLRLVPPAVSLALLAHTAGVPTQVALRPVLLAFAVLAAVYGAIVWFRVQDDLRGRLYWIIALAGFCFAGAIQSSPEAVVSWGLAMLYPGAALFLSSVRTRRMLPIGILSVLSLLAVPFTPTFSGLMLYRPFQFLLLLLPLAHVLLIGGFIRHMMRETEPLAGVEPWVRAVYMVGLALLPLTHIVSAFITPGLFAPTMLPVWPMLVFLLGVGLGVFAFWRKWQFQTVILDQLDRIFSLRWLFRLLGWIYAGLKEIVNGITWLLEGEGGLLWTLVFLVILVSILGQLGQAGGGI